MRIPSPPTIFVGDISIINFDIPLHDMIGEHNDDYFDTQEFLKEGRESSCEELEEDAIDEGGRRKKHKIIHVHGEERREGSSEAAREVGTVRDLKHVLTGVVEKRGGCKRI